MKKMKSGKLSLTQAAEKLALLTEKQLASLPPTQRHKKIQAFNALASEASSRLTRNRRGKPSRSASIHHIPSIPFAARGR
jgi:hypothetical protein